MADSHNTPTLADLQAMCRNTLVENLGIEFTAFENGAYVEANMPVDSRTVQPFRFLHGGASVALAETLGSIGAQMYVGKGHQCMGLEINANHLRAVPEGPGTTIVGRATPLHLGRNTHVWQIDIKDQNGRLCCTSRLTIAVVKRG